MKSWLQLFRVPNLFTVPGDPLAGFLLASAGAVTFGRAVFLVIIASLALYSFGLVLNDLMDYREDLAERPKRPLPSGAVNRTAAWIAAILLLALGLGICGWVGTMTFYFGCAIAGAVIAYNCGLKKIPVAGAVVMGACRGMNLLLGATLVNVMATPALGAAMIITIYITGVTSVARIETASPAIPPLIGRLIRALILIQAAFCAISGTGATGVACALVLALALWPLSRIVGRRFYAS